MKSKTCFFSIFWLLLLTLFPMNASAQPLHAPPANDDFTNAVVLGGVFGTVSGSNVGATKENWEPKHAGNPGGASIWVKWTAPESGSFTFDTIRSNFDTLLAVYTWPNSTEPLKFIQANDDANGYSGTGSMVSFKAEQKTIYYIAIDGYGGATGQVVIRWVNAMPIYRVGLNRRPAYIDEMYSTSGSPLTLTCSSGKVKAGTASYGFERFQKPVLLDLCFEGFGNGSISISIQKPDNVIYGIPDAQEGVLGYVMPVNFAAGTYKLTATQGNLTGTFTFEMIEAKQPRIMIDPDIRYGKGFRLYMAGFPASTWVPIYVYERISCPPSGSEVRTYGEECFQYFWSIKGKTNPSGRGNWSFVFVYGTEFNQYDLCAQPPNQAEVCVSSFTVGR